MKAETFHRFIAPAAAEFFPAKFNTPEAQAMILAVGLQESEFTHRQQLIGSIRDWWKSERGPAVSFFQFERIGIREVLRHRASRDLAIHVLDMFGYPPEVEVVFDALKHNDLLAAVFARLALWRHPAPLPMEHQATGAWFQYTGVWAPGKPKPLKWPDNYRRAWEIVTSA